MSKRVQVITGGGSGMGFCAAKRLGEKGPVLIGGRTSAKLDQAVATLREMGIEAYGMVCDTRQYDSVQAFAARAQELGEIGAVVHAAGISASMADSEAILRVNIFGAVNVVETFYPLMSEGSVLINIASLLGHLIPVDAAFMELFEDPAREGLIEEVVKLSKNTQHAYSISKRFVMYYTLRNTTRFAKMGARILTISPGSFNTPMIDAEKEDPLLEKAIEQTPVRRMGNPEEIGAIVAYACSDDVGYLTGCDILVDGGYLAGNRIKQLG